MKMIKKLFRFLFVKNEESSVFYIQGSDVLPKPLEKEEEQAALIALEHGDEEARNTLIEHNLRLVVYIAKRYETNPIFMEDLISIGSIGLIKAVNTFKRDKNIKLVTYASRCIENEILMFLRKKSRRKLEVSFDEPLNIDYDGNELLLSDILGTDDDIVTKQFEREENKRELLKAMRGLKDRERQILQMRYGIEHEELTQKDIAKRLGISQSYISRLEKRIIHKLKLQMKQQNY
ncbi:RNA polymerase sporulation sigma factor SigK [Amedibacillus dolichus]|uniref:RNA polymerase sigma factor n=1 Tax=Amedibacillus dolichus TaxID=31971 RepID=A0A415PKQ7_9FIRM|nr:RNA polymerase sporulation sigma factor SigK [Amedibacillus dolichus]MCB5373134.1 RNA polymerase sporulation sigma factor SigK [Amedibacillus dolichus]RHM13290.1 RNA polymerase sporulation sigma factor SigK [Amedibacillus dolichus]